MDELQDYDLDVISALRDFPKNEEDSFVYIRGKLDKNEDAILPTFVNVCGTEETLRCTLYAFIESQKDIKEMVYDAVLMSLKQSTIAERKEFIDMMEL